MADIKQASLWIREGYTVERESSAKKFWVSAWEPFRFMYLVSCADGGEHQLDCFDLEAEDWRIAE
jgi:hypothetical protein